MTGVQTCALPICLAVGGQLEYVPGWTEDISAARSFDELPANCQAYVHHLEDLIHCRISGIGVGPGREESIIINPLV